MIKVAVLITCFNRKDKTLECIKRLYKQDCLDKIELSIFIVDGGSSDGTPDLIKNKYPDVHVDVQNGLFWAGGMRKAWKNALSSQNFDFLWLVNDDTFIYDNCLALLLEAHKYSVDKYGKGGIYSGCTKDPKTGMLTYGGKKLRNPSRIKGDLMAPNGKYQECDLCNGNILLIANEVFKAIGGLSNLFTHGIADWEYSIRAKKNGYPVLLVPDYLGECERDHGNTWLSQSSSLHERLKYLHSPKGLSYNEFMAFIKTYFPKDYYPMKIKLWLKTFFPFVYDIIKK